MLTTNYRSSITTDPHCTHTEQYGSIIKSRYTLIIVRIRAVARIEIGALHAAAAAAAAARKRKHVDAQTKRALVCLMT